MEFKKQAFGLRKLACWHAFDLNVIFQDFVLALGIFSMKYGVLETVLKFDDFPWLPWKHPELSEARANLWPWWPSNNVFANKTSNYHTVTVFRRFKTTEITRLGKL